MKKIILLITTIFFTLSAYTQVVTIAGYLHVYPEDLGEFPFEPTAVIGEINRRTTYGYNDWSVPTEEELELIKSNSHKLSGLRDAPYLTTKNHTGKLRLVTTGLPVSERKYKDKGVIINGITWATSNVDKPGTFAKNPEEPGMFYQWNSKAGWSSSDPFHSTNGSSWDAKWNGNRAATWQTINNVCPPDWRVPTQKELKSLVDAGSEWVEINGKYGHQFGSGDNTIFLPAAGFRQNHDGTLKDATASGNYWSNMANCVLDADSTSVQLVVGGSFSNYSAFGFNVRCVAK